MEELLFIIVVIFIFPFIFLYSRIKKLMKRLDHMERYLQKATTNHGTSAVAEEQASVPVTPEQALRDLTAPAQEPVQGGVAPDTPNKFAAWLREDWLMKLGGLLVILGIGWFVSYAILQGWIGEMGRIALGLTVGAAVLALGRYRMKTLVAQGSTLMFIGAVIIVLTIFAARELYDMFTPFFALLLIFGTSCLLGVTSVKFNRKPLAYANVLMAAIAPLLVSASFTLETLFLYLFVLAVGSLWVAGITGWRNLPFLSLIIVGLWGLPYLSGLSQGNLDTGLLFAFAFTVLFFGTSIAGMRVVKEVQPVDLLTALGSGMFLLMWVLGAAAEEWQSMLLVAWTLVFAFGAFTAQRLGAGIGYFYSYASVGVVLLGVATALELDGPALTIAAIFEAVAVLVVGLHITRHTSTIPILAIPSIIPILLSFESMSPYRWREGVFHEDALVLLLMIFAGIGVAFYFEQIRLALKDEVEGSLVALARNVAAVLAGLYAARFVWLFMHALFTSSDVGTTISLVIYTIVGSMFFMVGKVTGKKWQRVLAAIFIGFVTFRLLFVEVWDMALEGRILTFLIVGVVLIAVAWFERSAIRGHDERPSQESHE